MSPTKPARPGNTGRLSAERIWTTLYNAESRLSTTNQPVPRTRRGRPPSPNPREITSVYLTDQEKAILKDLTQQLEECLPTGSASNGQIIGFALRLTAELIDRHGLPSKNDAVNWTSVAEHLMKGQ